MSGKIIITGSTGLIGKKIFSGLKEKGYDVIVFSRNPERAQSINPSAMEYVRWNVESESDLNKSNDWEKYVEGTKAVIHLAGESIMAERWNSEHKKRVLNSRIFGTRSLVEAIGKAGQKPDVFICASAIGYYGSSESDVDETFPAGNNFLSEVVKRWEEEAARVEKYNVRRVNVRTGIVLDKNEGALAKLLIPFKLFVGGPLGSGKQWFPWIHLEDVAGLFLFSLEESKINGAINAVSPNPVRMKEFCKILGRVMHRPSLFKVPEFILRLVLGEAASTVIEGVKVIPKKVVEYGFKFSYENVEQALRNILNEYAIHTMKQS